jgi:hypothetical protein
LLLYCCPSIIVPKYLLISRYLVTRVPYDGVCGTTSPMFDDFGGWGPFWEGGVGGECYQAELWNGSVADAKEAWKELKTHLAS